MSAEISRNWLFTLNNPTESDDPTQWGGQYVVYQKEQGQEGTPHLQGYIMFLSNKRMSALKKISARAHWERRKGSHEQAVAYCTKEDTRIEEPVISGTAPVQGKRNDVLAVKEKLDAGRPLSQIWDSDFQAMLRYERGFRSYLLTKIPPRSLKTYVTVSYGPTGTGKSRRLHTIPNAFWKPKGDWWDGYEQQEHVVIDEFYGWLSYDFMLRLLDRYPLLVQTKGGTTPFTSKFIHFTSNKHPSFWYNTQKHPYPPLERRLDVIMFQHTLNESPQEEKCNESEHSLLWMDDTQ